MTGLLVLCLVASAGPLPHASAQKNQPPPQKNAASSQINRPAADPGEKNLVVRVTAEGKPVAGAQVAAILLDDFHTALTNADGLARVPLPAGGKVNGVVALHPALGIGGGEFGFPTPAKPPTVGGLFQISLAPARPHTVRVVDAEGRPVPDLKCVVATVVWSSEDLAQTYGLDAARFQTDREGQATLAWIPRDLRGFTAVTLDEHWRAEHCITADGSTTIKARRLAIFNGHVRMPAGVSAEGLTISAVGAGLDSTGLDAGWSHEVMARARRDGSFAMYLAPGDAYSLALVDPKWASDAWTGFLARDKAAGSSDRAIDLAIDLVAYPATAVSVRVTRGPRHEPLADVWIDMRSVHSASRPDHQGPMTVSLRGKQAILYTNAMGTARFFVGKGDYVLYVAGDAWRERRTLSVTSNKPVLVELNRPSNEKQARPHGHGP
jgi:hypothetical protein